MSDALVAIIGGAAFALFIIGPLAADTSGNGRKDSLTWRGWCKEAAITLWAINPVIVLRDVAMGYEDIPGAVVRLMAGVAASAALLTSAVMIGWGLYRLFSL